MIRWSSAGTVLLASLVFSGCAASRSALGGAFDGPPPARPRGGEVSVTFIFTHVHQNVGWDAIPKVHHQDRYANGFYDFFGNALPILTNVGSYATFTDLADDVTETPLQLVDGCLKTPDGTGLGVRPASEKLERYKLPI